MEIKISGLEIKNFDLKMMVKSSMFFFYFEIQRAPSELLLTDQANLAFMAEFLALSSSNTGVALRIWKSNIYQFSPLFF